MTDRSNLSSRKIINSFFIIVTGVAIVYYFFVNFNIYPDAMEDLKFEESKNRDRQLYDMTENVVKEFYYGKPESAFIMAERMVREFPESIYVKRLIRDLKEYFYRAENVNTNMISIPNNGKKRYFIDKKEVTVNRYKQFIKTAFGKKYFPYKTDPPDFFSNPVYATHPIKIEEWDSGYYFCQWAGKRLPTPQEWNKAMRYLEEGNRDSDKSLDLVFLTNNQLILGSKHENNGTYIIKTQDKNKKLNIGIRCVSD